MNSQVERCMCLGKMPSSACIRMSFRYFNQQGCAQRMYRVYTKTFLSMSLFFLCVVHQFCAPKSKDDEPNSDAHGTYSLLARATGLHKKVGLAFS